MTVTLKENKDFLAAYKRGGYTAGKDVIVYFRKNGRDVRRLGITTGKKSGNAVERSRCRRIIRAAWRECGELFPAGFDYVIVARAGCAGSKSVRISQFLRGKALPAVKNYGSGKGTSRGENRTENRTAGKNPRGGSGKKV